MPVQKPASLTEMKRVEAFLVKPEELVLNHGDNGRTFARTGNNIESIKAHGQIHDVIVRPEGDKWRVVAGFGRVEDIMSINMERVANGEAPMMVRVARQTLNEEEALLLNIEENMARSGVSCMDTAYNVRRLQTQYSKTDDEVLAIYAKSVKRCNSTWLENMKKLLTLTKDVQKRIHAGELSREVGVKLAEMTEEERALVLGTLQDVTGKISGTKVNAAVRKVKASTGGKSDQAYTLKELKTAMEYMISDKCDMPKSGKRILRGLLDVAKGELPEPDFIKVITKHCKPNPEPAKA